MYSYNSVGNIWNYWIITSKKRKKIKSPKMAEIRKLKSITANLS